METLGPDALSEEQLVGWGERIGTTVAPPLWVSLLGPLGAGKSVLARAICRGAGVSGHIPSPSFTLVQSYRSRRGFTIHHVDLYRLRPGDDMEPLGWDDLIDGSGLVLVEWANRAADRQPQDRWEVRIDHEERADRRRVTVQRLGSARELIGW